jgi:hypothetical protein
MSEVITETILPGTYIEVRAEGLLTVGPQATGNIGIIGTAERGGTDIESIGSYEDALATFGEPGDWDSSAGEDNLGLVRAMKLLFDNGARTVYALRVMDPASAAPAVYDLGGDGGGSLKLRARTPGDWGNRLQIKIEAAEGAERLDNDRLLPRGNTGYALSAAKFPALPDADSSLGTVTVRDQGLTHKYQLKGGSASGSVAHVETATGALTFAAPPGSTALVSASYTAAREGLRKVTLTIGNAREVYVVPSLGYLAQRLMDPDDPSNLVEVVQATGDGIPRATEKADTFKDGKNGSVSGADFDAALDRFVDQNVQILLVAGRKFSSVKAALVAHVEKTENLGRERIAVVGADNDKVDKILDNANGIADKRVVLVAPGIASTDWRTGQVVKLPPAYTAAAVAGKLASVAPHVSLTNKTLAGIDGLSARYDYSDLKALVLNRVLAIQEKRGIRVVKAITTHDEAFKQITLRRIVDFVKGGTRTGADQYIGKLNNRRVRENLRTTLDNFLGNLVGQEFLRGYKLAVTASRADEINGEVQVTMDLNPTFSIDVIRVVANLS